MNAERLVMDANLAFKALAAGRGGISRVEGGLRRRYACRMTTEAVRQLLRGSVFRPFTVYADGKPYHVPHPEFAMLTPPGRTLVVMHQNDNALDLLDVPMPSTWETMNPISARACISLWTLNDFGTKES